MKQPIRFWRCTSLRSRLFRGAHAGTRRPGGKRHRIAIRDDRFAALRASGQAGCGHFRSRGRRRSERQGWRADPAPRGAGGVIKVLQASRRPNMQRSAAVCPYRFVLADIKARAVRLRTKRQCRSRPRPSFSDRISDARAATALRTRKPNGPQAAALFCGHNPVWVDHARLDAVERSATGAQPAHPEHGSRPGRPTSVPDLPGRSANRVRGRSSCATRN